MVAIKKRALPEFLMRKQTGAITEVMEHPLITDYCDLEGFDGGDTNVGNLFDRVVNAKGFPVPGIDGKALIYFHALAVILWWEHEEALFSDKTYRKLDHYLFHYRHTLWEVGPVGRMLYLDDLYNLRRENGWKPKRGQNTLSYLCDATLGKNLRERWVDSERRRRPPAKPKPAPKKAPARRSGLKRPR